MHLALITFLNIWIWKVRLIAPWQTASWSNYFLRQQLAADFSWFLLDEKRYWSDLQKGASVYVGTDDFPTGVFKMHLFLNALAGWHRGKCHSRVTFDKWSPSDGEESIKGGAFERSAFVFNWYCVNPTVSVSKPGATETHGCQTPSALSSCGAERRAPPPNTTKCSTLHFMPQCEH